jgi:Protein of unknown function (DUF2933)
MSRLSPTNHDSFVPGHSRYWIGVCAFLIVAAFFLWTEHRAHLLGVLPYLIFLLCPAIHFFMHRGGHGGHGGHHES